MISKRTNNLQGVETSFFFAYSETTLFHVSSLKKKKKKKIEHSTLTVSRCRMKVRWRFQNFFHDSMLEVKGDPSFSEKLVDAIVRGGVEQFVAALWNGCRLKT